MKKFLKNNSLFIIALLIIFGCVFHSFLGERSFRIQITNSTDETVEECLENPDEDYCQYYQHKVLPPDTISEYFCIFIVRKATMVLQFIFPFLVIIVSIQRFFKKMKGGYLKNTLTRMSYNKYFIREYLYSFKGVLLLIFCILLGLCFAYSISGHFDAQLTIQDHYPEGFLRLWQLENIVIFFICYFLNLCCHSIFWVNLGVLCCKKNDNFFVASIAGYVLYLILFIFFEVVVGNILFKDSIYQSCFNFSGAWVYNSESLFPMLLVGIGLAVISTLVVFISYYNKESVFIEGEK